MIATSHTYLCHSHIHIQFYHYCRDIWPQLRTRCAGEEAVPSTCVGGARPCAGRGATRARSAAPQRPRQVRANQVRPCTCGRWGATAPALEARRRYEQVRWKRPKTNLSMPSLVAILAQKPPMLCPKGHQPFGTKAQHATLLMHLKRCNFRPTGPFGITLRAGCAIHRAGRPYAALPLAVTNDIRHQPACGQLLGLRQLGLQLLSE